MTSLIEVLTKHGIYGFNGSQVACRCSSRQWRYLLDWHAHVAEAVEEWLMTIVRAEQKAVDGYSDPAWSALERVAEAVKETA